jgi:hypothetical protein
LLDCVDARRFRESGADALADRSSLALVRAMSTPRRWAEWFGLADLAKGDWMALALDDDGDARRAWEIEAALDYVSGPARSVRSMRRLGDGSTLPQGCSTLSTEPPLEKCVESSESGGISVLIER